MKFPSELNCDISDPPHGDPLVPVLSTVILFLVAGVTIVRARVVSDGHESFVNKFWFPVVDRNIKLPFNNASHIKSLGKDPLIPTLSDRSSIY